MFLRPDNQPAGIGPDYLLTLFQVPTWPPATSGKDKNEEGTQLPATEAAENRERALRAASWDRSLGTVSSRINPRGKPCINNAIHPYLILLLRQKPKNFNGQCPPSSNAFIQEKVFGKPHNAVITNIEH